MFLDKKKCFLKKKMLMNYVTLSVIYIQAMN